MGRPRLMLLDEPSMGLAPMAVETIFETITKLNMAGISLLVAEQNASGGAAERASDERVRALYLGYADTERA